MQCLRNSQAETVANLSSRARESCTREFLREIFAIKNELSGMSELWYDRKDIGFRFDDCKRGERVWLILKY